MTKWDEQTKKLFREATPEQKIRSLVPEIIVQVDLVHKTTHFLKTMDLKSEEHSDESIEFLLNKLTEASDQIKDVIELMFGKDLS